MEDTKQGNIDPSNDETVPQDTTIPEDVKVEETNDESYSPKEGDDIETLAEKNKHLYARAKRAEEALKKSKVDKAQVKQPQPPTNEDEIFSKVALMTSKSLSLEDMKFLEKVRQLEKTGSKEITLEEATESELFKTYLAKKDKEEKAKAAQLGASKGSPRKSTSDKPMTRDEHQAFAKEMASKKLK